MEYADALDVGIDSWMTVSLSEVMNPRKTKPIPLTRRGIRRHHRKVMLGNVVKHVQYSLLASKLGDSIVDAQIRHTLRNYKVYEHGWDTDLSEKEKQFVRNDRWSLINGEGQINRSPDRSQKTVVTLYLIPQDVARHPIVKDAHHLQYVKKYIRVEDGEVGPGDDDDQYELVWEGWSTDKFNTRNMEKGFGVMPGFPRDVDQHYPIAVRGVGFGFRRRRNNQMIRVDPVAITPYETNDDRNTDHGELDLYPNKEKIGDDERGCVRFVPGATRWLVTTYGKGDEVKTDVTVDDRGDVARVNSITVSNDNNALVIDNGDEDEVTPVVKIKIADEYRDDFFFAYKAVANSETGWPAIAKLRIPANAAIMGTRFETKMRCNKALVEQIWEFELEDGVVRYTEPIGVARSCVYKKKSLTYTVGQWVELPQIDEIGMQHDKADRDACAPGIHWCFSQEDALRFHFVRVDCIANAEIFVDANQLVN